MIARQHEGLSFEVQAPESAIVRGVASQLEAALRNLVINACGFANKRVVLRVLPEASMIRIEVEDDGPGLDAEEIPRIWGRFYSRRAGGTGLGLAMTRAVAEAHGGQVFVTSPDGALFTLLIPLQ